MSEQICTTLSVTPAMSATPAMSTMPSSQTLHTLQYADRAFSHYQLSVPQNQKFRTPQVTKVTTGQTSVTHVPLQGDCTHTERPETEKRKQDLPILHRLSHSPQNFLPPEIKLPVPINPLLGLPLGRALSYLSKLDVCTKVQLTGRALAHRLIGFSVSLTGIPEKNWKHQYLL